MARGTMYEIVSETKLKLGDTDICKLKEEDLYDYVGTEFDYCQDCDRKDGVSELMDYFKNSDFETGTDKLEVNGEWRIFLISSSPRKQKKRILKNPMKNSWKK